MLSRTDIEMMKCTVERVYGKDLSVRRARPEAVRCVKTEAFAAMECKTAQTRSFGVKLESMSIEAKGTHAGWSLERRLQVAHAFI